MDRASGDAFFGQGFLPGSIGAEAGSAPEGSILALNLSFQTDQVGGINTDFFISLDGYQPFLEGSKAALGFAFGLRAGSAQVEKAR